MACEMHILRCYHCVTERYWLSVQICDTIKRNESLVENVNIYFLTSLPQNFKMLNFDANPITIGYLVTELGRL